MGELRTRVRLTAKDWKAIADALTIRIAAWPHATFTPPYRRALGKIGYDGTAARDRGVAPVRKRSKPAAPIRTQGR